MSFTETGAARARKRTGPHQQSETPRSSKQLNVATFCSESNANPARRLIKCQDDVLLYELGQGRAQSYEVVSPSGECWSFPLKYQAESKFERLASRLKKGVS
jgi:hypothetical protein